MQSVFIASLGATLLQYEQAAAAPVWTYWVTAAFIRSPLIYSIFTSILATLILGYGAACGSKLGWNKSTVHSHFREFTFWPLILARRGLTALKYIRPCSHDSASQPPQTLLESQRRDILWLISLLNMAFLLIIIALQGLIFGLYVSVLLVEVFPTTAVLLGLFIWTCLAVYCWSFFQSSRVM